MQRIVYTSRRNDDTDAKGHSPDFDAIAAVAVERNKRRGITGFLICSPRWFAQVLEGPRQEVDALMEHIRHDPRHFDIQVLVQQPCNRPSFPLWGMKNDSYSHRNQLLFRQAGLDLAEPPGPDKLDALLSLTLMLANEQLQRKTSGPA